MTALSFGTSLSRPRRVIVAVGGLSALVCLPFLLHDLVQGYTFARSRFLARVDTPWDVFIPVALSFLLADLAVELVRRAFPQKPDWSDSRHFGLVAVICVFTLICLTVLYAAAVDQMIGPIPVGED
jgi:predicted acyltransferase